MRSDLQHSMIISPMLQPAVPSFPSLGMASLRLPLDFEDIHRLGNGNNLQITTAANQQAPSNSGSNVLLRRVKNEFGDYLLNNSLLLTTSDSSTVVSSRSAMEESISRLFINSSSNEGNSSHSNLSVEQVLPADRLLYRHSMAMSAVYCVAYIIVFVVGLIGNCFVIAVVYRSPRMRTVTNFFIVNLAVADVLVIVFCLPATLMSNIFVPWILGWFMCKTVPYIQGVSVAASIYSLVAVSLDRFLAIWWPLKCQITKRRARLMIVLIWFIALTTTLPWLLFFDLVAIYGEDHPDLRLCIEMWPRPQDGTLFFLIGNLMLCYVLPMLLISLCYVLIWIRVWKRHIPTDTKDAQMERLQQKSKVKVVKMLVVVVILFVLSWLPLYVIFTRIKLGGEIAEWEDEILPIATPIAQWLGSSNSCINPILYAFFNKKYRRGFMAILKSGRCCGKLRYYETVAIMSSSTSMRKSSYYVNNNNNNNNNFNNNNNNNGSTRRNIHGPPIHQDSNVSYIFNHSGV